MNDSRWENALCACLALAATLALLLWSADTALDIYREWPGVTEVQHVPE